MYRTKDDVALTNRSAEKQTVFHDIAQYPK